MKLTLTDLELMNFRNCRSRHLNFNNRHVVFVGANGVGKSNMLEAIFYLSILRSFRTATVRDMVTIGEKLFILRANINSKDYGECIEIEQRLNGVRQLFVDNTPIKRSSDFIREFRAVSFVPEDMLITSGSAFYRRRFFDMFIAVMEVEYLEALRRYSASITQRNAALRNNLHSSIISAFEPDMAIAATIIANYRERYAQMICDEANKLFSDYRLSIEYSADYPLNTDEYLKKLSMERSNKNRRNFTTFGPQLDDFVIKFDDKNLRNFGSNGQHRLTALYLKMAKFSLIKSKFRSGVVALVDDVTGELDAKNRERFFDVLEDAEQIFSTFTEVPKSLQSLQIIKI